MSVKADGSQQEDFTFLDHVLDKLYDFGSAPKAKSKKKKRRRCEDEEEEEEELSTVNESDGEDYKAEDASDHRPQQQIETSPAQVEVVTFQDPRKKLKTKQTTGKTPTSLTTELHREQSDKLSLEKARLDVHRFGITGYKKEQQRVFEQDRAVMLGARPPKKEYVNYKVLQQQIKEKKKKAAEENQQEKKKKQSKPRDKKKPSSGSGPSGQMGHFKNGMLVLSSKEIQKIKSRK